MNTPATTTDTPDLANATDSSTDPVVCPGGPNCPNPNDCEHCDPTLSAWLTGQTIPTLAHLAITQANSGDVNQAWATVDAFDDIEGRCEQMDTETLRHVLQGVLDTIRENMHAAIENAPAKAPTHTHA